MKKIMVGNWKMNPGTLEEGKKLLEKLNDVAAPLARTEVVICPPTIFLASLHDSGGKIAIGAQNAAYSDVAEHTGGTSPLSLADMGIKYVILGHSDRRGGGESSEDVGKKVESALSNGLMPIVCFGEKMRDADGEYLGEIKTQILAAVSGVAEGDAEKLIVAYEPVWAIGPTATRAATPDDLREVVALTRTTLAEHFGSAAEKIPLLYGGSANADNAKTYLESGADGLLVGRASRSAENFGAMLQVAEAMEE